MRPLISLALVSVSLGSCNDKDAAPDGDAAIYEPLSDARLLRRMSMDLRGIPPSIADLEALSADPAQLEVLRDGYLDAPELEDRMVSMLAERWHTRIDEFEIPYYDYDLTEADEFPYERSVGEEPLRLMAHVVVNDLPWTEIVTADYTLADQMLVDLWPLAFDDPGAETWSGWRIARYTDERPAAGVLSTNGLWWRYVTNTSNLNRARAGAIANLLLCQDLLSRPVSFAEGISLGDEEATANAIRNEPTCVACHASIEPLAATLFGFQWMIQYSQIEMTTYHPEREQLAWSYLGVEPAWFGEPISGLAGLGDAVAGDERFYRCAAETAAELLWRRPVNEALDFDTIEALRGDFIRSDLRMKALLSAVTDTEIYRAGALTGAAGDETVARERPLRMLSPDQLASAVEHLTGFRWAWEGYDQLANDTYGYRILTGGVDGEMVSSIQSEPSLTWSLVTRRLAQGAGWYAAEHDLVSSPDAPLLLDRVSLDDRPGDDAFDAQLRDLHLRLYSEPADDEWVTRIGALWSEVQPLEGETMAWAVTVSAMLRDPQFLLY